MPLVMYYFLVGSEHGSRGFEHVPCSAHRVPHMFRTSRIVIFTKKKAPAGCQWQAKGFKYQKLHFKNCLHFSISKNRILKIVTSTICMYPKLQILIIEAYLISNLGNVFRTCSAQFQLEQCSMPTKCKFFSQHPALRNRSA